MLVIPVQGGRHKEVPRAFYLVILSYLTSFRPVKDPLSKIMDGVWHMYICAFMITCTMFPYTCQHIQYKYTYKYKKKLNAELTFDQSVTLLGICPKGLKQGLKEAFDTTFIVYNSQTNYPQMDGEDGIIVAA